MSAELDIGYSQSATTWTYESEARVSRTSTFDDELALMGDRFIALLNAAKRLSSHGAAATRMHKTHALRRIARAVSKYSASAASPEDWLPAFANYLRYDESTADTTRWTHFNHGSAIIAEVARFEGAEVRFRNPFKRRRVRRIAMAHESEVEQLLRQAKSDVFTYVNGFRTPSPEHDPFVRQARELWRSGVRLSVMNSDEARKLSDEWRAATALSFQTLVSYVYPSAVDLAPFLLLIGIPLAGNPDSVSLMRRDALVPFTHPAYGSCHKLQLDKPRAGSIAPYLIRNKGTLSVGWLIDAVLEITAPLVPFASERDRNLAFLGMSIFGRVRSMVGAPRADAIRRYLASRQLTHVTLKDLRTYRGISEFNKSGDLFRVQRLLNQASVGTTIDYLDEHLTEGTNGRIIADAQAAILKPINAVPSSFEPDDSVAAGGSHTCSNPYDETKPHDENGICLSYLWPFNDRCFIIDFSPRSIAFVLRDYGALCEAQLRMPAARFDRYYALRKRKMEDDVLQFVNPALREEAEAIVPTLPAGPAID